LISFILLFFSNSVYNKNKNIRPAIIYSSVIEVMSAPSEESTKLFNLHIGTKVNINDQIENWFNIKLANGKKGWVGINHLKEI
jgi:SH3-like domain-containing protein